MVTYLTLTCHMYWYMYLGIVPTFSDVAQKNRHAESYKEPLDFRSSELVSHDFRLPDTF